MFDIFVQKHLVTAWMHKSVWVYNVIIILCIVEYRTLSDTNFHAYYFYFMIHVIVYYRSMYMAAPDSY